MQLTLHGTYGANTQQQLTQLRREREQQYKQDLRRQIEEKQRLGTGGMIPRVGGPTRADLVDTPHSEILHGGGSNGGVGSIARQLAKKNAVELDRKMGGFFPNGLPPSSSPSAFEGQSGGRRSGEELEDSDDRDDGAIPFDRNGGRDWKEDWKRIKARKQRLQMLLQRDQDRERQELYGSRSPQGTPRGRYADEGRADVRAGIDGGNYSSSYSSHPYQHGGYEPQAVLEPPPSSQAATDASIEQALYEKHKRQFDLEEQEYLKRVRNGGGGSGNNSGRISAWDAPALSVPGPPSPPVHNNNYNNNNNNTTNRPGSAMSFNYSAMYEKGPSVGANLYEDEARLVKLEKEKKKHYAAELRRQMQERDEQKKKEKELRRNTSGQEAQYPFKQSDVGAVASPEQHQTVFDPRGSMHHDQHQYQQQQKQHQQHQQPSYLNVPTEGYTFEGHGGDSSGLNPSASGSFGHSPQSRDNGHGGYPGGGGFRPSGDDATSNVWGEDDKIGDEQGRVYGMAGSPSSSYPNQSQGQGQGHIVADDENGDYPMSRRTHLMSKPNQQHHHYPQYPQPHLHPHPQQEQQLPPKEQRPLPAFENPNKPRLMGLGAEIKRQSESSDILGGVNLDKRKAQKQLLDKMMKEEAKEQLLEVRRRKEEERRKAEEEDLRDAARIVQEQKVLEARYKAEQAKDGNVKGTGQQDSAIGWSGALASTHVLGTTAVSGSSPTPSFTPAPTVSFSPSFEPSVAEASWPHDGSGQPLSIHSQAPSPPLTQIPLLPFGSAVSRKHAEALAAAAAEEATRAATQAGRSAKAVRALAAAAANQALAQAEEAEQLRVAAELAQRQQQIPSRGDGHGFEHGGSAMEGLHGYDDGAGGEGGGGGGGGRGRFEFALGRPGQGQGHGSSRPPSDRGGGGYLAHDDYGNNIGGGPGPYGSYNHPLYPQHAESHRSVGSDAFGQGSGRGPHTRGGPSVPLPIRPAMGTAKGEYEDHLAEEVSYSGRDGEADQMETFYPTPPPHHHHHQQQQQHHPHPHPQRKVWAGQYFPVDQQIAHGHGGDKMGEKPPKIRDARKDGGGGNGRRDGDFALQHLGRLGEVNAWTGGGSDSSSVNTNQRSTASQRKLTQKQMQMQMQMHSQPQRQPQRQGHGYPDERISARSSPRDYVQQVRRNDKGYNDRNDDDDDDDKQYGEQLSMEAGRDRDENDADDDDFEVELASEQGHKETGADIPNLKIDMQGLGGLSSSSRSIRSISSQPPSGRSSSVSTSYTPSSQFHHLHADSFANLNLRPAASLSSQRRGDHPRPGSGPGPGPGSLPAGEGTAATGHAQLTGSVAGGGTLVHSTGPSLVEQSLDSTQAFLSIPVIDSFRKSLAFNESIDTFDQILEQQWEKQRLLSAEKKRHQNAAGSTQQYYHHHHQQQQQQKQKQAQPGRAQRPLSAVQQSLASESMFLAPGEDPWNRMG